MEPACGRNCSRCLQKLCTRSIPIFATLSHHQLTRIAELTTHTRWNRGETICLEGHAADYVAIIQEGSAKAVRTGADGREQILYLFSEGDFFGERQLLTQQPAAWTLIALEPVRLCLLSREAFGELLRESPDIALNIIGELGRRLSRLENALVGMGARRAESRLAAVLMEFAESYGQPHPEGIQIRMPLSREGLASYVGMARETVSRKLGQLEDAGLLRSLDSRRLLLLAPEALAALAQEAGGE